MKTEVLLAAGVASVAVASDCSSRCYLAPDNTWKPEDIPGYTSCLSECCQDYDSSRIFAGIECASIIGQVAEGCEHDLGDGQNRHIPPGTLVKDMCAQSCGACHGACQAPAGCELAASPTAEDYRTWVSCLNSCCTDSPETVGGYSCTDLKGFGIPGSDTLDNYNWDDAAAHTTIAMACPKTYDVCTPGASAPPLPCTAADCNSHGSTSDTDKSDGCDCSCNPGWHGADCSTPPPCDAATDCSGHGTTSDADRTDGCHCTCSSGYSGKSCGVPPPCTDADCSGHGSSSDADRTDGCACSCTGDFSGDDCSTPPPCKAAVDCSGHGTTTDLDKTDGCDCSCTDNFSGDDCSVPPVPCDALGDCNGHGATSDMDSTDGCTCVCTDGFSGQNCGVPPPCTDTADCSGHGTTSDADATDGCDCECEHGFSGADCSTAAEPCTAADCNGHGTTADLDRSDGCTCSCANGFTGETCSELSFSCFARTGGSCSWFDCYSWRNSTCNLNTYQCECNPPSTCSSWGQCVTAGVCPKITSKTCWQQSDCDTRAGEKCGGGDYDNRCICPPGHCTNGNSCISEEAYWRKTSAFAEAPTETPFSAVLRENSFVLAAVAGLLAMVAVATLRRAGVKRGDQYVRLVDESASA